MLKFVLVCGLFVVAAAGGYGGGGSGSGYGSGSGASSGAVPAFGGGPVQAAVQVLIY